MEGSVNDSSLAVPSPGGIALPGSDLFETVRRKLLDDLGHVQVERRGQ